MIIIATSIKNSTAVIWSPLDKVNKNIIRNLFENSRISISDLSKAVHLSARAVKERMEKLEEQKAIIDYTIKVDNEALDFAISGFVQANVLTGKEAEFNTLIETSLEITECFNVTREKAFISKVCVKTTSELDRLLETLSTICKTETSLVLSESITPRLPNLKD